MAETKTIEGFECYAPELAISNEDFPTEGFEVLFKNEEQNFWFISRNQVILSLFRRFTPISEAQFLEIGCGTGYVLKAIAEDQSHKVTGAEIHVQGLMFARKRLPHVKLIQLDATRMPFSSTFDAIGAFDVLEHITEDELVMAEVRKALKPGGHFYITVPQYPWMWSYLDDVAFHKRRYTRTELKRKLEKAGYEVKYIGSFVFALFPAMVLSRLFKKESKDAQKNQEKIVEEFNIPRWMNQLFRFILKIDVTLIKWGIQLPFGGSLVAVAQNKAGQTK
jgi:SAM-dependent methyltransferase